MNRRNPSPPPRAFTLIEILVVVAIIGILSTLLVLGVSVMSTNAKRQQTRAALEQCRAMYADWDAITHQAFAPSVMPSPQNVQLTDRYGPAVWFTRDVMFHLRSTPANAAALGKMSPGAMMTFPSMNASAFPTYTPTLWKSGTQYIPFDTTLNNNYGRVYVVDPTDTTGNTYDYYDCIQAFAPVPPGPGSTVFPSADPTHWFPAYPVMTGTTPGGTVATDNSVPVLLDGWGNPIIFVPGGTLGTGTALSGGIVAPGSGSMRSGTGASAITTQAKSPDGRPFFASAGPDGDFSNGDDNLYSFEK